MCTVCISLHMHGQHVGSTAHVRAALDLRRSLAKAFRHLNPSISDLALLLVCNKICILNYILSTGPTTNVSLQEDLSKNAISLPHTFGKDWRAARANASREEAQSIARTASEASLGQPYTKILQSVKFQECYRRTSVTNC